MVSEMGGGDGDMMLDRKTDSLPEAKGEGGGTGFAASGSDLSALRNTHFHQLVTLLEKQQDGSIKVGDTIDPGREHIRFRSTRSLSFGPGDISEVSLDAQHDRLEIRVNFFGLYGPASPLPPYYTERIIEEDQSPSSVEDFFDFFNHRLITLLHVIWRKYRYYLRYEAGGIDPLSKRFLAFCGFPIEDRGRIGEISRSALLPHIGLMSLYSSSPNVVAAIISNFFDVPCRIQEFVPRRVGIDEESRLQLGKANNRLDEDAILGDELDDDLGKFRICLGTADYHDLAAFLPHGDRHGKLGELLLMIQREPLEWDIEYDFDAETIPQMQLGEARLGWSSWLPAHSAVDMEHRISIAPLVDS